MTNDKRDKAAMEFVEEMQKKWNEIDVEYKAFTNTDWPSVFKRGWNECEKEMQSQLAIKESQSSQFESTIIETARVRDQWKEQALALVEALAHIDSMGCYSCEEEADEALAAFHSFKEGIEK